MLALLPPCWGGLQRRWTAEEEVDCRGGGGPRVRRWITGEEVAHSSPLMDCNMNPGWHKGV